MAANASTCPLCGYDESSPFYDYTYKGTGKICVENRVCNRCGAVHLASPPTAEALAEYYAKYLRETLSEQFDIPLFFEEIILSIGRMRTEFIAPVLKDGAVGLDIGCSFGGLMKVLRDESGKDIEITGLNPEPGPAAFAREKYGLDVQVGMFEDAAIPEGGLDFIILDNVIEHFLAPSEQLARIHRSLNEDGLLIVMTNNAARLHGHPWQNFFDDHVITYSPVTLKAQLESTGFTIVENRTDGHVTYEGYHYPYQSCIARKGTVPADYDFGRKGEAPDKVVRRLRDYTREYYKENRWAKLAFDAEKGPRTLVSRLLSKSYRLLATICGQPEHVLHNHTLPPEEFYLRRVVMVRAEKDSDDALGISLALDSGLNPEYVVIRDDDNGIRITKATPYIRSCCGNIFPSPLRTPEEVWAWLEETLPSIAFRIQLDVRDAITQGPHVDKAISLLSTGESRHLTLRGKDVTCNE